MVHEREIDLGEKMSGFEPERALRMGFGVVKSEKFPSRGTVPGGGTPPDPPLDSLSLEGFTPPPGGYKCRRSRGHPILIQKTLFWLDSEFQKPKLTLATG